MILPLAPSYEIRFVVPGAPVPWARTGAHGGQRFTPARQRSFKHDAQSYMLEARAGRPIFDEPLQVVVDAYWPRPKSLPKRMGTDRYARPSRPDCDNALKILMDAGNGVLWTDDALVTDARVRKWVHAEGDGPRIEVVVRPVGEGAA